MVAIVLLGVAGVLGFDRPGFFVPTLDQVAVQNGVRSVLLLDYHLVNVTTVVCPGNQKVVPGRAFDCIAVIDNVRDRVHVRVRSRDGHYEVGRPS